MPTPNKLQVNSDAELDALRHAVDMAFDVLNDMFLDTAISTPNDIRDMHNMSDDSIRANVVEKRQLTNDALDQLLALAALRERLKTL